MLCFDKIKAFFYTLKALLYAVKAGAMLCAEGMELRNVGSIVSTAPIRGWRPCWFSISISS